MDGMRQPWPVDWTAVFRREAPLLLEIGFGNGQFLLDLARKRPSANVLGLEISLPSLRRAAGKLANAPELAHVRILQADAQYALWALCRPQTVQEMYINFPDPWPKAAHHHRRLISDSFLHLAATRMPPGALLEIATDHAEYAEVIETCLRATPYFDGRTAAPFLTDDPNRLRTKYEQKGLAEGRPCRYFKWRRNETDAPDIFPIPREGIMPHIILRTSLTMDQIKEQFEQRFVAAETADVKFLEIFQSGYDGKLLVEVYINEEPLSQRLGLTIRRRRSGEVILGVHEVGFPRPTRGVHLAVHHLYRWLLSLDETAVVIDNNLPDDIGAGK